MEMKNTYTEANPGVESLIHDNMELVRKIAWHMHGRVRNAVEIDDLLQVGYFGLVNAAQKILNPLIKCNMIFTLISHWLLSLRPSSIIIRE